MSVNHSCILMSVFDLGRDTACMRGRLYIDADVLESAHGWATNLFNKDLKAQFDAFYACPDTFSLALLGVWVAHGEGRCF